MYSNVHSIIIYKSQYMEATQVPQNGWMDKEDMVFVCVYIIYIYAYIHTYTMEYYSVTKNEWHFAIRSNMFGPRLYYV